MKTSFLNYEYYWIWVKKKKSHVFFFYTSVQILHFFLIIFGFRKIKKILDFFSKDLEDKSSLNEKEVLVFREHLRLLFKKLRKSRYCFCNCFSTSLLLWFILKKQGLNSEIRIGTRKINNEFKAHAWVEINNIPLNAGLKVRQKFHTFNFDFSKNNISITSS